MIALVAPVTSSLQTPPANGSPQVENPGIDDDPTDDLSPEASADGTAKVIGAVEFHAEGTDLSTSADNQEWHGIRNAKVKVMDFDLYNEDDVVDTVCTDPYGQFASRSFTNGDGDGTRADIYIKVTPRCDPGVDLIDGSGERFRWTSMDDSDRASCETGVNDDIPDGTFDIGTCEGPGLQQDGWTIRSYAYAGLDQITDEGVDPGVVTVQVPAGHGAEYHEDSDEIHVPNETYVNGPDVLTHEVGHFAMDAVYGSVPDAPNCNPHSINLPSSEECAWNEGWANYFAVQSFVNAYRWEDNSGTYDNPDFDYGFESQTGLAPTQDYDDDVEATVAGTLWDTTDGGSVGGDDDTNGDGLFEDTEGWSFADVFGVFQSSGPDNTFPDYRDGWEASKPERAIRRPACDNWLDEYDDDAPTGIVDAPNSAEIGDSYTVYWTSSDRECGVTTVTLQENPPLVDTWTDLCTGGPDGSCTVSHTTAGEYCYRAEMTDGADRTSYSAKRCTDVLDPYDVE